MTFSEWSLGIIAMDDPKRAKRIRATLEWVRRSCEAERLPDWCVALVVANVEREAVAGMFPLLTDGMMLRVAQAGARHNAPLLTLGREPGR